MRNTSTIRSWAWLTGLMIIACGVLVLLGGLVAEAVGWAPQGVAGEAMRAALALIYTGSLPFVGVALADALREER